MIKKRLKLKRKVKFYFVELMFIILILFSIIKMVNWLHDNDNLKQIVRDYSEDIIIDEDKDLLDRYKIDFTSIKEKNSDTVAWIKLFGTNIEYLVVKANDNEFYLNHDFDKKERSSGWVFANYLNKFDGTDKNISLFAHARIDGSMFGTLKNALTSEWQKENNSLLFITEKGSFLYQVFSTYKVLDEALFFSNSFASDEDYMSFLKTIKSRSNYDYQVELNKNDKIITLSTCDINNRYRIILHAKLVEERI